MMFFSNCTHSSGRTDPEDERTAEDSSRDYALRTKEVKILVKKFLLFVRTNYFFNTKYDAVAPN
jgi:hypothetical protein